MIWRDIERATPVCQDVLLSSVQDTWTICRFKCTDLKRSCQAFYVAKILRRCWRFPIQFTEQTFQNQFQLKVQLRKLNLSHMFSHCSISCRRQDSLNLASLALTVHSSQPQEETPAHDRIHTLVDDKKFAKVFLCVCACQKCSTVTWPQKPCAPMQLSVCQSLVRGGGAPFTMRTTTTSAHLYPAAQEERCSFNLLRTTFWRSPGGTSPLTSVKLSILWNCLYVENAQRFHWAKALC